MFDEHHAFQKTIADHPEDPTPKLVYADYLEENGDPLRAHILRKSITDPYRRSLRREWTYIVPQKQQGLPEIGIFRGLKSTVGILRSNGRTIGKANLKEFHGKVNDLKHFIVDGVSDNLTRDELLSNLAREQINHILSSSQNEWHEENGKHKFPLSSNDEARSLSQHLHYTMATFPPSHIIHQLALQANEGDPHALKEWADRLKWMGYEDAGDVFEGHSKVADRHIET